MADNLDINNTHKELAGIDFIVFAGTGATSGTGLPETWTELLNRLHKKRPVQGVNLEELNEFNYPAYAEMLFNGFENEKNPDGYYNMIEEELRATKSPYGPLQLQIFYTTGRIITTNFEDSFEKAFQIFSVRKKIRKACQTQILPNVDTDILKEDFCITYLHGRIDKRNIVFRTTDFTRYYPDDMSNTSKLEQYLMDIYDRHTIVFVGFGFMDKYLKRMLRKIYNKLALRGEDSRALKQEIEVSLTKPPILHYAFLQRGNSELEEELDNDLRSIGIGVVRYLEHVEVVKCFERIEKSRISFPVENENDR
jgi:hypothetical protein